MASRIESCSWNQQFLSIAFEERQRRKGFPIFLFVLLFLSKTKEEEDEEDEEEEWKTTKSPGERKPMPKPMLDKMAKTANNRRVEDESYVQD